MKKLFVSIVALTAFGACQSGFDGADSNVEFPEFGANNGGEHKVFAEVGVGEDTKAGYDENLAAIWEENDQIALLQEHADYGKTFSVVNKLNIQEGWGTNSARFNGEASVDSTDPRIYHIVYPASAASFSVSMSQEVAGVSYENHQLGMHKWTATGYAVCTYNSTLNVTVPTTQKGKWEPYMYASTSEAVSPAYIGAKTLTTLTGAIGILAFEADGTTPKQLKSLAIIASKPIAGAFTGSATSVGNTVTVTGEKTDLYTAFTPESEVKAEALDNLKVALRNYEPTSTSVTKAMSLSFAGSETTVSAENLETIAADSNGNYTYYLNVAPFEGAEVTIIATAVDGSTAIKTATINSVAAGQRVRGAIVWESATLTCGSIETWYEDWNTSSFELAGSTIYANNLKVDGVAADHVVSMGLMVNDVLYGEQSGVSEISQIKVEGLASGKYTAYAYAKVMVNGEEKILTASVGEYTVTTIPTVTYTVQSSYSKNGTVAKTNSINGNEVQVTANISDSYVATNLVNGNWNATFSGAGSFTLSGAMGAKVAKTGIAYGNWGQYNCSVKVTLKNGYVCEAKNITAHITGIPYTYDFYQGGADTGRIDRDGWKRNGTNGIQSNQFYFGQSTSKTGYVVSPKFYVPSNFDTTTTLTHKCYCTSGSTVSYSAYSGAVSNQTSTAKTVTYSGKATVSTGETASLTTHKGDDKNVVLSGSAPYMCIGSNGCGGGGLGKNHYLHKVVIEYR